MPDRESMHYDVVIVGAGPAGLCAAIKLKQLARSLQRDISVCIIEKGSEVGAHILSGAVLEPRALNELLPDWQQRNPPFKIQVSEEDFLFLTRNRQFKVPAFMLPRAICNQGNYPISLGLVCQWLAEQAEHLGVEIYPGFPAAEVLYDKGGAVCGVATADVGIDKKGQPKADYQPGMALKAKYTLFAEGCRGYLSEQLMARFNLRQNCQQQTYGLGFKEIWEVDSPAYKPGKVVHTVGWPLDSQTYGGSFIYHFDNGRVAVGLVVGLDYKNPYFDPFNEFQRFKTHPYLKRLLTGGRRLAYGARCLNEGGVQSLPNVTFPGGALIGDGAGFMNVAKIKGSHNAMKSGMLAAEAIANALGANREGDTLEEYNGLLQNSWIMSELNQSRNIRPAFARWGLYGGALYAAMESALFRHNVPWTLSHRHSDREATLPADKASLVHYPAPDKVFSFDRNSSLELSNVYHDTDQPAHLKVINPEQWQADTQDTFDNPEIRYCPAGVYELDDNKQLHINAENCLHCKTCDIKDPADNIRWTPPPGGGPIYTNL